MAGRMVKVMTPGGEREGEEIQVDQSIERWSEVTLEDGTIIKVKATVVSAIRIPGEFDPTGQPLYVVNMAPTTTIAFVPDSLKKQPN